MVTGLRSEWTAEQVRENLSKANEDLPEATATDRFPLEGTASGIDFEAGEEAYDESTAAERSSAQGLPADPPQRHQGLDD
jgi:hypothetical protein